MELRPDDEVVFNVRVELRRDPRVHADEIAVRADRGIVWLVGTVNTPLERTAAEHAAERVTGALMIEDKLTARPPGPGTENDAVLRAAALQALADRGVRIGEEVDVTARDGRLTMTGRMQTAADRAAAAASLQSLPHVASVANEIRVATDP
jgi:osmotically-inducible protein OsmY